jgi:hypothetical protein
LHIDLGFVEKFHLHRPAARRAEGFPLPR